MLRRVEFILQDARFLLHCRFADAAQYPAGTLQQEDARATQTDS